MRRALPRRARAVAALLAALALGGWAAATAHTAEPSSRSAEASAQEGPVHATLTYREGLGGPLPYFDLKLAIARSGTIFYEQPVASHYCPSGCVPEPIGSGPSKSSPLAVSDLEGNGEPDVVLELSTGGAHCCTITQVFSLDPGTMTYRLTEHDFGDPGALLTDVAGNGQLEFESADDRFAYEFTSYAYSGLPLQIWRFHEGGFIDVTSEFPKLIAADAKRQLKYFLANRRQGLGLGFIAAWAGDEYLLGHRTKVASKLAAEARLHHLRSAERITPSGQAFIERLKHFLKKTGYS
jgi:hypothetical protein